VPMPTLLKRSNGVYYVVSTDHEGRRKWVSTGQRLKSSAIRALAEKAPRSPKVPKSFVGSFATSGMLGSMLFRSDMWTHSRRSVLERSVGSQ
jgi:hypothetical protein